MRYQTFMQIATGLLVIVGAFSTALTAARGDLGPAVILGAMTIAWAWRFRYWVMKGL